MGHVSRTMSLTTAAAARNTYNVLIQWADTDGSRDENMLRKIAAASCNTYHVLIQCKLAELLLKEILPRLWLFFVSILYLLGTEF